MPKKTKSTAGTPKPPQTKNFTYWITRDSDPETGEYSRKVRVWLAKPDRERSGPKGFQWKSSPEAFYGEWDLGECLYHVKTYPDDDRQCIRVEGDGERQPGEAVDRPNVS